MMMNFDLIDYSLHQRFLVCFTNLDNLGRMIVLKVLVEK